MAAFRFTRLPRAVLRVTGEDRQTFLQGLVSNDVAKASPDRALWAGFLTAQGKFLWDLFIVAQGDSLLVDVDADGAAAFARKLSLYKLRAKVTLTLEPDLAVFAVFGGDGDLPDLPGLVADGRLPGLGGRAYGVDDAGLAAAGLQPAALVEWDRLRLGLGVPDGLRDMVADKSLLLECGFDELGGVDFNKGCYMGQELTARTKYRGLVKKRLLPVRFDGPAPAPGTPVLAGEAEAGEMRSGLDGLGLAQIRLEQVKDGAPPLTCGGVVLRPFVPDWMVLPAAD